MSNTRERLAALNAKQRKALSNTAAGYAAIAMVPGICILAFIAGLYAPMPERTYDLVQYHGSESDIIDYDLSISDCVDAVARMRAAGLSVSCEVTK